MNEIDEPLEFLLRLNQEVVKMEEDGKPVVGPGLPPEADEKSDFITNDRLCMPNDK